MPAPPATGKFSFATCVRSYGIVRAGRIPPMYLTAKTLDDLMHNVLERLLRSRNRVAGTRGATRELNGVLLKIANPRARLSRSVSRGKVFSGLGELMWYLSGR